MLTSVLVQIQISGEKFLIEKFFSGAREFFFETRLDRDSLTSLIQIQWVVYVRGKGVYCVVWV